VTRAVNDTSTTPTALSTISRLSSPVRTRDFSFDGMSKINGRLYDINRVDFQVPFGQTELWRVTTSGNAPHPVHVHGASFQVQSRKGGRGKLFPWEQGWKDTVLLEDRETVEVLIRFDAFRGLYLIHCHKLEHEDMGIWPTSRSCRAERDLRDSGRCGQTTRRYPGMGRLAINNAMSVNGAYEAPSPDEWLVLDPDSNTVSLEQFLVAEAMVLGRKTYEGLAAVWPTLVDDPLLGSFADRLNSMPKYVASRTLRAPLAWNATLLEGDLAESVAALKDPPRRAPGRLRCRRAGPCPHRRGPGGRVLVLGESVSVADRTADLRWCRAAPPVTDRVDDIPVRRAATGLPAGNRVATSWRHGS
jgi:hypothetical protein